MGKKKNSKNIKKNNKINNNDKINNNKNGSANNNVNNEKNDTDKSRENVGIIISVVICFLLIACVMLFGLAYIKNAADDVGIREEGYRNLCQVVIVSGNKIGKGIVIGTDEKYIDIITPKHLVDEENHVTVEFGNKGKVESEVCYYFKKADAAIIRLDREITDIYFKGAKEPVLMSKNEYESIPISEHVFFASDIYDTSLEFKEGIWVESDKYVYEISSDAGLFIGEVLPGMSGEGVFDKDNKLIGMIVAASDTEGAVIPAYELRNEYMQWIITNYE